MSYATLEKQLRLVPEAYLNEVSEFIEFVIFRHQQDVEGEKRDLSRYFGTMKINQDGLA